MARRWFSDLDDARDGRLRTTKYDRIAGDRERFFLDPLIVTGESSRMEQDFSYLLISSAFRLLASATLTVGIRLSLIDVT
jgi:hypothetical protein